MFFFFWFFFISELAICWIILKCADRIEIRFFYARFFFFVFHFNEISVYFPHLDSNLSRFASLLCAWFTFNLECDNDISSHFKRNVIRAFKNVFQFQIGYAIRFPASSLLFSFHNHHQKNISLFNFLSLNICNVIPMTQRAKKPRKYT